MYKLITTLEEMQALKPEWDSLGKAFASPMLQFDWFFSCAKAFYLESQLRIFLIYNNNVLIAIAPMVEVTYRFSRWLEIIGTSVLYEPTGLIYQNNAALKLLLLEVYRYRLPVNLQRIAESSAETNISTALKSNTLHILIRDSASSYYLEPESNWEEFLLQSGKKWRADFRNKANRAQRMGEVQIEFVTPDSNTLSDYFNEAVQIESRSWKGQNSTSLADKPALRAFFMSYFSAITQKHILHFAFYHLNGQAIAMHISVLYNNRIWSYKIGYDDKFSRISPGIQLILSAIQDAFKHNYSYEFLGSNESWQEAWPVKKHKYCSIIVYPLSFHGVLGFFDTVFTVMTKRLGNFFRKFKR